MNRKYILAMFLLASLLAACGSQSAAPVTTLANASSANPATLVKAGYTNVWNLDGGMAAWEQQGLPLKEK